MASAMIKAMRALFCCCVKNYYSSLGGEETTVLRISELEGAGNL
jgi:hypothetical protein